MNFSLCEKLMYFGLKSLWEPCFVGTLSKAKVPLHFADA